MQNQLILKIYWKLQECKLKQNVYMQTSLVVQGTLFTFVNKTIPTAEFTIQKHLVDKQLKCTDEWHGKETLVLSLPTSYLFSLFLLIIIIIIFMPNWNTKLVFLSNDLTMTVCSGVGGFEGSGQLFGS